jgi:hypothetical protein
MKPAFGIGGSLFPARRPVTGPFGSTIRDIHGSKIGSVDTKGRICDAFDQQVGEIDMNGKISGISDLPARVDWQGSIVNINGNKLGSIGLDGSWRLNR